MPEKPNVTLPGTVEKVIPSPHPSEPEKAQISVKDGDDLYKEIRIENTLQDEDGNEVALKEGAEVKSPSRQIKRIRRRSVSVINYSSLFESRANTCSMSLSSVRFSGLAERRRHWVS